MEQNGKASGPGWERMEDGNYLWRAHRHADTKIISEKTFLVIKKLRSLEFLVAIATGAPIFVAFMRGTSFAWLGLSLVAYVVLNGAIHLLIRHRISLFTNPAPASEKKPAFTENLTTKITLRGFSDRQIRNLMIFFGLATAFGIYDIIRSSLQLSLPGPQVGIHPLLIAFSVAMTGPLFVFVSREWLRRRSEKRA